MRSVWLSVLAGAAAAWAVGCAASSGRLPTPEELVASGVVPQASDTAVLRRGRALSVVECVDCHRFYWPDEYPRDAWPMLTRKMGRLASLGRDQVEAIERYLVAASRATRPSDAGADNTR